MVWLPGGEKMWRYFIRFDATHERDRQTDTHTLIHAHTPHDDIGRACIASRGKMCSDINVVSCLTLPSDHGCCQHSETRPSYCERTVTAVATCWSHSSSAELSTVVVRHESQTGGGPAFYCIGNILVSYIIILCNLSVKASLWSLDVVVFSLCNVQRLISHFDQLVGVSWSADRDDTMLVRRRPYW